MIKSRSCKWYNFDETAPANEQEVLIKCDDGFYVAKYDASKKGFLLRGKALLTEQLCNIHWMPIVFP